MFAARCSRCSRSSRTEAGKSSARWGSRTDLERPAGRDVRAVDVRLRVAEEPHVAVAPFDADPFPHLEADAGAAAGQEGELLAPVAQSGDRGGFVVQVLAVDRQV